MHKYNKDADDNQPARRSETTGKYKRVKGKHTCVSTYPPSGSRLFENAL